MWIDSRNPFPSVKSYVQTALSGFLDMGYPERGVRFSQYWEVKVGRQRMKGVKEWKEKEDA